MKSPILSLLTIFCSFLITYFSLNFFNPKKAKEINKQQIEQEIVIKGGNNNSLEELEDDYDNQQKNSINEYEVDEITLTPKTDITITPVDFPSILADYNKWEIYHKESIDLSTDFNAIDHNNNKTTKKDFITALKTGKFIPVKLSGTEHTYQLHEINASADKKISKTIKRSANLSLNYYLKEGGSFPDFNFEDINGNSYTSESTKGSILVIECWFLQCKQCIEEIPMLNDLYDKYESHDDIIFFCLSFDETEKMKTFLSKTEYRYSVITNQSNFIKNKLKAIQYPTHLIVDKEGNIKKMVNNVDSLILALDTMTDEI